MKVYRMIPKCNDFIFKPKNVIIEEHEGDEFETFSMKLHYYKQGKLYHVIDPQIGLRLCSTTKKSEIRSLAESKMANYHKSLVNNKVKVVEISNTYFMALKQFKNLKELQEASDFDPLRELALWGSNTQGGKLRILDAFLSFENKNERIKFLKKEYGEGGFGIPRKNDKEFLLHQGWWNGSGIQLKWYVPYQDEEVVKNYTYNQLEEEINKLIKQAKYI